MNWNLETTTKEQAVLLLLPSPDHIQMPSCDLLWLNTISGLGERNLVCCLRDISRGKSPVVLSHMAAALVASGVWSEVRPWEEAVTTQLQSGVVMGMAKSRWTTQRYSSQDSSLAEIKSAGPYLHCFRGAGSTFGLCGAPVPGDGLL